MARYRTFLSSLWGALRSQAHQLAVMGWMLAVLILASAGVFWLIEKGAQDITAGQALYWATITITGVGYGDIVPATAAGKAAAGIVALIGIGLLLMLTGIVAAGFVRDMEERRDAGEREGCPHCGRR